MAYYASKSSIKRSRERRASIAATGHYGGRGATSRGSGSYSRYASEGKGLGDVGTQAYAAALASKFGASSTRLRDYTTFVDRGGVRKAKGSFQVIGLTAASLGFGTGMMGGKVTGDTGLTGYEFAAKYQAVGVDAGGNKLYFPRVTPQIPNAPAARGMVGSQTVSYTASPTAPSGVAHAAMGGGGGDWQRPQPKVETPSSGAGIGTVVAVGGIGYLLWSMLK